MGEQGGLRTGWLAAFGTEGYEGEPPLLEELGVNFGHIKVKVRDLFPVGGWRLGQQVFERVLLSGWTPLGHRETMFLALVILLKQLLLTMMPFQTLTVLNPFGLIDQHIMDDSDLAGPILFFLLFGTFLLFSGKVHFGYIYGLALVGSLSLHTIFSLMSPDLHSSPSSHELSSMSHGNPDMHGGHQHSLSPTLTFPRSASVLGYCLLPLVLTSLVGVALPMDTGLGYVLTSAAIAWCTYSSSGMFCAVGRMRGMRPLVAYPLALFYVGFGIMGIFSSRGSGALGDKISKG